MGEPSGPSLRVVTVDLVPLKQVFGPGVGPLSSVLERAIEFAPLASNRGCRLDREAGRWRRTQSGVHLDLRHGSFDVTGCFGSHLSADRCPLSKHCPCGNGIGVSV